MDKKRAVPLWVMIFVIISFLVGVMSGFVLIFSQGIDDSTMGIALGARNIGLGLVAGLAVWLRNPAVYSAALFGGISRDLGDLFGELSRPETNMTVLVVLIAFLLAGIGGLIVLAQQKK